MAVVVCRGFLEVKLVKRMNMERERGFKSTVYLEMNLNWIIEYKYLDYFTLHVM